MYSCVIVWSLVLYDRDHRQDVFLQCSAKQYTPNILPILQQIESVNTSHTSAREGGPGDRPGHVAQCLLIRREDICTYLNQISADIIHTGLAGLGGDRRLLTRDEGCQKSGG